MIPNRKHGDVLMPAEVRAVERALGLEVSWAGRPMRDVWDAIAHECRLPDTEDLKRGMDYKAVDVLPAPLWNAAVRIANQRAA